MSTNAKPAVAPKIPRPPVMLWRWVGLTWIGYPKPLRWLGHNKNAAGCGCIKMLADLWHYVRTFFVATPITTTITNRSIRPGMPKLTSFNPAPAKPEVIGTTPVAAQGS